MENIKINTKKLIVVLTAGFILITSSACSKENKTGINNNQQQESSRIEVVESEVDNNIVENNSEIESIPDRSNSDEKNTVENPFVETYTSSDKEAISYFNNIEQNVDNELYKEKSDVVKDKLKGTFITIVDFLFYDSEINGIKFNDLTEGAKQNVLETVASIDNKIMTKYPNYKEEISSTTKSAYNKASEVIKKGSQNVKEFSKEKLGEENYNSIIDAKDELVYYTKNAVGIVGEFTESIWETGKSKIKTWYENFRN